MNSLGVKLENSKFFNFFLGVLLQMVSMMEGSPVVEIVKCAVASGETFWLATSFPQKSATELKQEASPGDEAVTFFLLLFSFLLLWGLFYLFCFFLKKRF